tara:strand:+ start:2588 stop:4108 length:1521 start_codon:yes stop_codon:yes gene_type:complete
MSTVTQSGFDLGGTYNGTAAPGKQTLASNYIDFTDNVTKGWFQQYVPDLIEKEAEVFGNRTISGFLSQVGAEEASTADQVVWSEQGRLHLKYTATIEGHQVDASGSGLYHHDNSVILMDDANHAVRVGDTVLVSSAAKGKTVPCLVTSIFGDAGANNIGGAITLTAGEIAVAPIGTASSYKTALGHNNGEGDNDPLVVLVYGSAYAKGTNGRTEAVEPEFKSRTNSMMIMKDLYEVNGSDVSQIGWVEVSGEEGQSGYYWYLKAAGDTRTRFTDYCEMAMIESVKAVEANIVAAKIAGSEGLFAALDDRGIIHSGIDNTGGTAAADNLADFDDILKEFDKQGAIEEYMMFLGRTTSLAIDDMLASQNSYGQGGTSYGVFDNDEDMALNLGFSGFRRGSYDFYKTDWKYLNDIQTRGALTGDASHKRGVFVPAGVSSVYDQNLGKNLKRPFLHVRYRSSATDNRKMKSWTTGSVGATTSDLDAMQMHFLTERCLVVQGANNFCMIQG